MNAPLLEVENLSLSFRQADTPAFAVSHVSFTIEPGEMLALVGESGSGKSLTALSCLGLQPPSADIAGVIRLGGQTLTGINEDSWRSIRGKRIGMIFQEPMTALNPLHTVEKQIGEMLTQHQKMPAKAVRQRVLELLEQVGLPDFEPRLCAYPHQLSGGERQRVMIAMAIANQPELLIADEPTTAVDVTLQVKILDLLKKLQAEMNMAILFITHDLTIVRRLADRVAVMSQGEIVEQGRVATVFASPQHPYTRKLLAAEPKDTMLPFTGGETLLTCGGLSVEFRKRNHWFAPQAKPVRAVQEAGFTLRQGETLGIVGESGSGKSTLAFALLRLQPSTGSIVFLGKDLHSMRQQELRPLRRQMQLVFQDPYSSLNPRMTIGQIIEEGLLVHRPELSPTQRQAELESIMADVGLMPSMLERYPHAFSGGQRQRISIARAMILRPKLVILDEPTSALDLSVQSQILHLLKDLQAKYGLSYLFISHDLRVVRAIAHSLIVMKGGKIVESGPVQSIFEHPKELYTQSLINAAYLKR